MDEKLFDEMSKIFEPRELTPDEKIFSDSLEKVGKELAARTLADRTLPNIFATPLVKTPDQIAIEKILEDSVRKLAAHAAKGMKKDG